MRKAFWVILVSLVLAALVLVGCAGNTSNNQAAVSAPKAAAQATLPVADTATPAQTTTPPDTEKPVYGGTMRILTALLPASPMGWPAKTLPQDTDWTWPCVEALLRVGVDQQPIPWLVKSWEIAPDKTSITLHLQQNVKFHDLTDFNAEAVKFNLDAVREAKVSGTTNWTSIDVIDTYTVRINLSSWSNLIYGNLAGTAGRMVSPTWVQTKGIDYAGANPCGTGPFTFVSYEKDTTLTYKKFENYWRPGEPYLDGIVYHDIPDSTTQINAWLAGEGDMLTNYSAMPLARAVEAGYTNAYRHDGVFSLYPDSANADSPFSNPKVRMALEYAIDKAALVKVTGYGIFEPAYQLMTPGSIGYIESLPKRTYDETKAKALMAEAGYPDGFKCTLAITIPAPDIKDAQVAIQNYLSKIGITCTLEYADAAKYADYIAKGWHNTLIYTPAGGEGNLTSVVQQYFTIPGYYVSLKAPEGLMEAYKAALATDTPDKATIEKQAYILYDDDSIVPINYMGTGHVYDPKHIHGMNWLAFSSHSMWTPETTWISP